MTEKVFFYFWSVCAVVHQRHVQICYERGGIERIVEEEGAAASALQYAWCYSTAGMDMQLVLELQPNNDANDDSTRHKPKI